MNHSIPQAITNHHTVPATMIQASAIPGRVHPNTYGKAETGQSDQKMNVNEIAQPRNAGTAAPA